MGFLDSLWTHIHSEQQHLFEAAPKPVAKRDAASTPKVTFAQALQAQIPRPLPPTSQPAPLRPHPPSPAPAPVATARPAHSSTPTPVAPPAPQPLQSLPPLPFKTNHLPTTHEPVVAPSDFPLTLAQPNRMTEFIQPALPFARAVTNTFELQATPYQLTLNFMQQGLFFSEFQADTTLPVNPEQFNAHLGFSSMVYFQQEVSLTFSFSTDASTSHAFNPTLPAAIIEAPVQEGDVDDQLAAQFAAWWGALQSFVAPLQQSFSWANSDTTPVQTATPEGGDNPVRPNWEAGGLLTQLPFAWQPPRSESLPLPTLPQPALTGQPNPVRPERSWLQPLLTALNFKSAPLPLALLSGDPLPVTPELFEELDLQPLLTSAATAAPSVKPNHQSLSPATVPPASPRSSQPLQLPLPLQNLLESESGAVVTDLQTHTFSFSATVPAHTALPKLAPLLHQIWTGFHPLTLPKIQDESVPTEHVLPTGESTAPVLPPVTALPFPSNQTQQDDSQPQPEKPLQVMPLAPESAEQLPFAPETEASVIPTAPAMAPAPAVVTAATSAPVIEPAQTPVTQSVVLTPDAQPVAVTVQPAVVLAPTAPSALTEPEAVFTDTAVATPIATMPQPEAEAAPVLHQPAVSQATAPNVAESIQSPVSEPVKQPGPPAAPLAPAPAPLTEAPEHPFVAASVPAPMTGRVVEDGQNEQPTLMVENEVAAAATPHLTQPPSASLQPTVATKSTPTVLPPVAPTNELGNETPVFGLTEQVRMAAKDALPETPRHHSPQVKSAVSSSRPVSAKHIHASQEPQPLNHQPQAVAKASAPETPVVNLNPVVNPHLSSAQLIKAINDGVYFADIPRFLQEVIQSAKPQAGVVQSVNVTLRPEHLGEISANFTLHENKAVTITLLTQTDTAQKTLQNYINEIHQVMASSQYKVQTLQIAAATPSQQQQQNQQQNQQTSRDSQSRQLSEWRRKRRRNRANENNLSI